MWEIQQQPIVRPLPLPPYVSHLGATEVRWFAAEPGVAVIQTKGGTIDDRWLAECILRESLAAVGWRQARYIPQSKSIWYEKADLRRTSDALGPSIVLNGENNRVNLVKTGDWNDIMAKAKRLVQSGNVTLLRNGVNIIVAHVVGDHGEYTSEISRDDPNSRAITQWTCECPWDQYAFQRTRKWKKYEARPCAHVLAAYWKSLSSPLDEEYNPDKGPGPVGPMGPPPAVTPGGGVTAPDGFQPPGGIPPTPHPMDAMPAMPAAQAPPMAPMNAPSQMPPMMAPPGGNQIIPPYPMDQQQMQQPVSVPGGRGGPYPANPLQQPGTLSKVAANEFLPGTSARVNEATLGQSEGREGATDAGQWMEIPRNAIVEVIHQDPTMGWVEILYPLRGPEMTSYHVRCFIEPEKLTPMDRHSPFQNPRRSSDKTAAVIIAPMQSEFINWTGKRHADPQEVSENDPTVLNAYDNGKIVGSILAYPDWDMPNVLSVESVWVEPDYRSQGLGARLIAAAKKASGATQVAGMAQTDAGRALLNSVTRQGRSMAVNGSDEPEIIHYPDDPDIEPSMGSGAPFIFQPSQNKLHLGQEGWYHRHVLRAMDHAGHIPHGNEGVVYMPEGHVQFCYGSQPDQGAINALSRHYGQPLENYEPLWQQEETNWGTPNAAYLPDR